MLILLYKSCVACTVVYQNSKIQHHLLIKVLLTTSIKVVKIKNFKFPPKCVQERLKMPFIRESKFKFFCPSAPPPLPALYHGPGTQTAHSPIFQNLIKTKTG